MIVNFTAAEIAEIQRVSEEYTRATDELEARLKLARPDDPGEPSEPPQDNQQSKAQRVSARQDFFSAYEEWVKGGSPEWQQMRLDLIEKYRQHLRARQQLFAKAELRQFEALSNDPQRVYEDAREQMQRINAYLSDRAAPPLDDLNHENLVVDIFTEHCFTDHDNAWYNTVMDALHLHVAMLDKYPDMLAALQTETRKLTDPRPRQKKTSKRKLAQSAGHMIDMGCRSVAISDHDLQFALSQRENKNAFIINLGADLIKNLKFEDGRLTLDTHPEITTMVKNSKLMPLDSNFDYQLLRSLFSAIYLSRKSNTRHVVTVYLPELCKHLGIEANKGSAYPLFEKINAFKDFVGTYDNGSYSVLLEFIEYNKDANTMTFASPYMARIINAVEEKNKVSLRRGGEKIMPGFNFLMHSNIGNERNKVAVELAHCIVNLILQRGVDNRHNPGAVIDPKDGQVVTKVHIAFSTLLDYVPELAERIAKSEQAGTKNTQLRRAFSKTYDLLKKKTDVYHNYIELNIPAIIPTVSTLATTLEITHKGLNPKYRVQR